MLPCIIYMFIWTTVIYDPIACWTWNPKGWTFLLGVSTFLDFFLRKLYLFRYHHTQHPFLIHQRGSILLEVLPSISPPAPLPSPTPTCSVSVAATERRS